MDPIYYLCSIIILFLTLLTFKLYVLFTRRPPPIHGEAPTTPPEVVEVETIPPEVVGGFPTTSRKETIPPEVVEEETNPPEVVGGFPTTPPEETNPPVVVGGFQITPLKETTPQRRLPLEEETTPLEGFLPTIPLELVDTTPMEIMLNTTTTSMTLVTETDEENTPDKNFDLDETSNPHETPDNPHATTKRRPRRKRQPDQF